MTPFLLFSCAISLDDMAKIVTIIVSIVGLIKVLDEYGNYLKRQRIQFLIEFGTRYTNDDDIKKVILFLEKLEDDHMYMCTPEYVNPNYTYNEKAISIHSIEMFMRFIEEIELLIRAGSISESSALYLFGHYTLVLDKYNGRWPNLGYNECYWNVYRRFVNKAKEFDYKNVTV